jgi:PHD/YefM family antitoxin component YafN of YafNO toxin-antitoxin module
MQNTNPKQLRAEMKDYLELAAKEPIRIQRRSGESFILLKEDAYLELQTEVLSLQRRLLGMSQVVEGKTKEHKPGDRSRLGRLKAKK